MNFMVYLFIVEKKHLCLCTARPNHFPNLSNLHQKITSNLVLFGCPENPKIIVKRGKTYRVLQFMTKDFDKNLIEFHEYDKQSKLRYL